ncbi:hypothetical protein GCM10022267_75500 [Lentzea roselyniae]|uniref:Terpene synthase n=1 Tax=Lentzea roselyniae TaxID=531940 RepID=A0ABP7C2D2_9PSEU
MPTSIATLPDLWCPFPSENNPHSDEVDGESFRWLNQHGLLEDELKIQRLRRQRSGALAGRTNPEVDATMLRLLSDWYVWLFAFDDGYCESVEASGGSAAEAALTISRLTRALDSDLQVLGAMEPFARSLQEVRDRVDAVASDFQLEYWKSTVRDYLAAQMWEVANREADRIPDLDEYLTMRRHTGATYTCLTLIDVTMRLGMSLHDVCDAEMRSLLDITANLVSWDNDLYSHAKEMASDQGRHNLVGVLAHHRKCSTSEAWELATAMRDREMRNFVATCAQVEDNAEPQTRNFVRSLGLWLRGHIEWSRASSRFEVAS